MSVTSGFFNSINHDRMYDATQFSDIFDGVINDGVFANIGDVFAVKENAANIVSVGLGKAWFNKKWIDNDAILPLTMPDAELLLDRYDAVVIEVDESIAVRNCFIKFIKGTPASDPQYPALANTETLHQYPLAFIHRKQGSTSITQADIINAVGTSYCPYITGILEVHNIDNIVAQWEAQWLQWMAQWDGWEGDWQEWYENVTSDANNEIVDFIASVSADFERWYSELQAVLEPDVATNLAAKVTELQERFRLLAEEGCVYESLEDSDGVAFTDEYGGTILGTTSLVETGEDNSSRETNYISDLNLNGNKITGLGTPSVVSDAANKGYVDNKLVKTEITFYASKWSENADTGIFSQTVEVASGGRNSIISLQPTMAQTQAMLEDDVVVIQVDNEDGIFTARAIGGIPSSDITIQAIISEVKI